MANHYQTIALSSGGVTQTKNVETGDTLYITAVPPSNRTNPTPQIFVQTTNCSSNVASDSSSPYNFTITNFTSSTYSAYIFFADSDNSTTVYQGTVSGSVSSASVTAPTASSVTFDNPASANTTATVNLSASGSGGTLEYACEVGDTTPDNWQTSSTFTISRGSGTVYAQARRSSTATSNTVSATRPGFLTGDTAVAASNSTIANGATSASTTLSSATAGETYAVRVNNGSSNLATRTGNGAISFTSSLPSSGNTSTYEIFVRRPTSTGGDGTTYTATNDTFTVSMSSPAQDTTPNAFSFTDKTGDADTVQNSYVQITGINAATTVSRTSGGATFAVVGTSQTPSSGNFGTSNTTITNNQYLHVKQTTSSTYNAVLSTVMNVGGVTDTWVVTTNPAPGDGTPENYSFTDVTTALSTVAYAATQITGISQSITVSRTSGAAVFAISNSGTTTPNSSGFSSSNKTITNNQYIWLKQTSSSSNSTTLTSQFSAGGVSASWNLTTVAASGSSGAGFGLQIFPPTGTIARLDTTDRTARVLGVFTGTLAAGGGSATFTQPGFSASDTTIGVEWQTSGDHQYVSLSSSGTSLTVTRANDPSSFSNNYQVRIFRI